MDDDVLERLQWYSQRRPDLLVVADVPLCGPGGDWPEGTADHRIDAIAIDDAPTSGFTTSNALGSAVGDLVADRPATLIVGRSYFDRPLLGLLLGGSDMFSRSYPRHGRLSLLTIADGSEANIRWVYRKNGVEVVVRDA